MRFLLVNNLNDIICGHVRTCAMLSIVRRRQNQESIQSSTTPDQRKKGSKDQESIQSGTTAVIQLTQISFWLPFSLFCSVLIIKYVCHEVEMKYF